MKITFLGTSHGYAEANRFQSSALVEVRGKSYIIDAGAPVEYQMATLQNCGMGLLFAFLGVFALLRKTGKEVKDPTVTNL